MRWDLRRALRRPAAAERVTMGRDVRRSAVSAPLGSIMVGDIRVTYLPDGEGRASAPKVFPTSPEELWDAHSELLDEHGKLLTTIGGFLVETGDRKVVIDLGLGDVELPFPAVDGVYRGGKLLDSLRQAGVEPEDVNTVYFTHLHLDHVGWTTLKDSLTFPMAGHMVGSGEWEFWRQVTDEALAATGPNPGVVKGLVEGRLESVEDGGSIAPGVTVLAAPGHTPGHTAVVVSSGTDRAIIVGDSLQCPLQLDDTSLNILFDMDPSLAQRTRELILRELEEGPQTVGAFGHFPESAFGRVLPGQGQFQVVVP